MNLTDRILADFEIWCARHAAPGDSPERQSQRAYMLLDGRARWGGRANPLLWRSGDVHAVLYNIAVRKLTDVCGLAEHGVETLRAYLEYLEQEDRFHASSAKLAALLRELERAAAQFPAAMADPRRYAMAKRFMTAAREAGVDVADDSAMQAWLDRFNACPAAERAEFLGPLCDERPELVTAQFVNDGAVIAAVAPGRIAQYRASAIARERPCACGYPPVRLAPPESLARDAASALTLRRLAAIAEWCAPGRAVGRQGAPVGRELAQLCGQVGVETPAASKIKTMGDVPEMEHLWQLAVEQDVVRAGRRTAIPGPRAELSIKTAGNEADCEATLELWLSAFQVAVIDEEAQGAQAEQLDQMVKAVVAELYRTQGPVSLDAIERALERAVSHEADDHEVSELYVTAGMQTTIGLLGHLHRCAAVSIEAGGPPGGQSTDAVQERDPKRVRVELTPLGVYGAREYLIGTGCDAPLVVA
ncbi:hypothetical protein [Actinocrinis puniceicyclus]|nr:hypothetical protein [Actinocrinis puniceicyclus]